MNNQSFSSFFSTNSNSSNHTQNLQGENFEIRNISTPSVQKQFVQKKQSSFGNGTTVSRATKSLSFSNSGKRNSLRGANNKRRKILSVSQILTRVNQKKQRKLEQKNRKKPFKPIIPPKSFILLFKDKPEKYVYNRRIIDYKHCGLLQRYIGLGGKILPRRQTRLTAKQQRYVAKTIKSARIMGLLPFVTKERSFFR